MENKTQNRKIFIDILRFFAVLLITNSHMKELYPSPFTPLATGGAIGDALFFFCSGYALMLSRGGDFFNWYKKRVVRIFPAIFAMAIIHLIMRQTVDFGDILIRGGGWFIQCIFVFYFVFWFVKRYFPRHIPYVMAADLLIILIWYCFFWDKNVPILYDGTYLRWPIYFLAMLFGAYLQTVSDKNTPSADTFIRDVILLLISIAVYYALVGLSLKPGFFAQCQIVTVPVLLAVTYFFLKVCSSRQMEKLYSRKTAHNLIYWISAMCLEIYLCQTDVMFLGVETIKFFPLNVLITFVAIFLFAYVVKILGNFLSQTFKTEEYDWKKMLTL